MMYIRYFPINEINKCSQTIEIPVCNDIEICHRRNFDYRIYNVNEQQFKFCDSDCDSDDAYYNSDSE